MSRAGLDLRSEGRDYDVRVTGKEIWLMEGDRLVAYATGEASHWHLLIEEHPYAIEQPKLGNNVSWLLDETRAVGEIRGSGFPLRAARFESELDLSAEVQAFVVMIALLGWREGDRSLLDASGGLSDNFPPVTS
jgi:hypothetical protein